MNKDHWIYDTHRQIHIDASAFGLYGGVYDDFNAETAAEMHLDAGAQVVSYFAKCLNGYSYYPTKIGSVHPNLKVDFIGEFTRELKKRGMKCIAYFYLASERREQESHQDWAIKFPDNFISPDYLKEPIVNMCLNTPYVEDFAIPQMIELIKSYDIDGFFIDMSFHQYFFMNCQCKVCQELYSNEVGGKIPLDDTDQNAYLYRKWRI